MIPLHTAVFLAGILILSAAGIMCVVQTSTLASWEEDGLTVISYGARVSPADTNVLVEQLEVLGQQYYPGCWT